MSLESLIQIFEKSKKQVPQFFSPFCTKRQDRLCTQNLKSLWVQRHILLNESFEVLEV